MVFSLPFHIPRFFRPTFLDVFNLTNTSLGDIFAVYGITAMLTYFPGGFIADYFSARILLAFSLISTALGGLYLAQFPSQQGLLFLFAYWGVTSILLFWAALIRATREWGGKLTQGRAFGLLDGGRGLVAAGAASIAVLVFSTTLPIDVDSATHIQRKQAIVYVIYTYSILTFFGGVLVYWILPRNDSALITSKLTIENIKNVLHLNVVWYQAIIVFCAYCGYKGLDNYALYAVDVLNMNEVESARFTSIAAYLRPVAAVAAGLLADKYLANNIVKYSFLLLIICYSLLIFIGPTTSMINIIFANLIITYIAVFALRGVYFALLEESKVSKEVTGIAVGLISVIGFLPDIFFYPIAGRLLDAAPGVQGHQYFFALLAIISIVGITITITLLRYIKRV